uniref:Rad21/Rec8-like protein N-terminal domain-containing protein n=1 Tax=Timema cristinae TaxID=61476 RepID=A0A7R9GRE9_TIMCR|nr:unnamed protein product [Timema cristinae]
MRAGQTRKQTIDEIKCAQDKLASSEEICRVVLTQVPRDSSTGRRPRFSLYLSSQLLYGVCVIRQKQLKMFLDEISNFFISVHSTKWTIDLQTEKRPKKKHGEKRGEDDLLIDIQRKKQKLDIGVLPPDIPEQAQVLTFPNVVDDHLMELPTLGELPVDFLNGDLDALLRSMTEDLREHVERPPVIEPLREDTTLLSMKQSLLDPSTSDATGLEQRPDESEERAQVKSSIGMMLKASIASPAIDPEPSKKIPALEPIEERQSTLQDLPTHKQVPAEPQPTEVVPAIPEPEDTEEQIPPPVIPDVQPVEEQIPPPVLPADEVVLPKKGKDRSRTAREEPAQPVVPDQPLQQPDKPAVSPISEVILATEELQLEPPQRKLPRRQVPRRRRLIIDKDTKYSIDVIRANTLDYANTMRTQSVREDIIQVGVQWQSPSDLLSRPGKDMPHFRHLFNRNLQTSREELFDLKKPLEHFRYDPEIGRERISLLSSRRGSSFSGAGTPRERSSGVQPLQAVIGQTPESNGHGVLEKRLQQIIETPVQEDELATVNVQPPTIPEEVYDQPVQDELNLPVLVTEEQPQELPIMEKQPQQLPMMDVDQPLPERVKQSVPIEPIDVQPEVTAPMEILPVRETSPEPPQVLSPRLQNGNIWTEQHVWETLLDLWEKGKRRTTFAQLCPTCTTTKFSAALVMQFILKMYEARKWFVHLCLHLVNGRCLICINAVALRERSVEVKFQLLVNLLLVHPINGNITTRMDIAQFQEEGPYPTAIKNVINPSVNTPSSRCVCIQSCQLAR